ncbi:small-conductance mechanosensitive channel [Bacteroidales bacterium 6E]|nr:small-conductance mechanosensitive channel [Bacteroidales bacterium 6E]
MEKYFTIEMWEDVLSKLVNWVIYDLPGLLFIFVLLFILLRLNRMLFKRMNGLLIRRARKHMEEESFETEKRINTLTGILKGIGRIIIWAVFIMIILKRLGIDIAPILAGAGIIGLAVGFGAQELVRDFISGFFMLLENQIRTGDVARINGTSGAVESIELRTTTLRDFEGIVHIFQNGKINSLSNMTKDWSAFAMDIGVAYKENVDKVMEIIKDTGADLKNDTYFGELMLESIEVFGLDKFGDSAVMIKARIKTKTNKQWEVGREFNRRLKYAFDNAGIEIPFPHTTIYWGEEISPLKLELQKQAN